MPNKDLTFNFFGRDVTLSDTLVKMSAQADAQAKAFQTAFGKVPAYVSLAAAGAVAASVAMASKFQSQMTLLQTAGGESSKNIGGVASGILDLAVKTGTSTTALAEGMYTVEKAGIRGADGLKVLKAAAEGAKAENVDLGTATNALTSVMMSYHLGADKAVSVQNMLVAGAGAAKTTMQEYADSLSTVIPVASAAGIGFDQVGGAIATLTQHGTSAQESTQELANTIRNLMAPNHVAATEMQQLGINVTDLSQHLGDRGLTGTIQLVEQAITKKMGPAGLIVMDTLKRSQSATADAKIMLDRLPASIQGVARAYMDGTITQKQWRADLKGMHVDQRELAMQFANTVNASRGFSDLMKSGSPAAQTFAGALDKVMGGSTGMNTALMLGGENMAYFKRATEEVGAAGRKTGADISTWKATQSTLAVAADQAKASLQVMGITIGTALLPPVTQIMKGVAGFTTALMNNKPALYTLLGVLGAVAAVMTTVYVAQKVMTAGMAVWRAAVAVGTAVQWAWNAAMDANPIGIIIVAIAALVAGLIWFFTQTKLGQDIWKNFTKSLGEAWNNTVKWIGDACKWLHDHVFKPVFDAIGAIFHWWFNDVVKPVFDAVSNIFAWIYNNIIRPYVGLITLEIKAAGFIFHWLYENAVLPVANFIGTVFNWIYNNVIKPVVGFIQLEIRGWGIVMHWLHDHVVRPVIAGIGAAFKWVHDNVILPVVDLIKNVIRGWGIVVTWLHDTIIKPVFDKVSAAFHWVYDNVIKPVTDKINDAINAVGDVVNTVFGGIRDFFGGMMHDIGKVTDALGHASGLKAVPYTAHADGGVVMPGELSLVGERGPELVRLPGGSRVYPTGTGPAQSTGLHIEHFHATPQQSPAEIAAELGWRMRWST